MTRRTAMMVLLLSAIIMGTASTAAALIPDDIPGTVVGAAALGVGGLLMFCVFARRAMRVLKERGTRYWVLSGGVLVCCYALAFYSSIRYAGAAVSTVVNLGSAPLFAAMLESRGRVTTFSRRWAVGTLVSIVGLVLLSINTEPRAAESTATPSHEMFFGVFLAALAGLLYAGYTFTSKRALNHVADAPGVMGATFGVGGLLLTPLLLGHAAVMIGEPRVLVLGAYLAVGPVLLGFWLFGVGLRHVDARSATTMTLIEPAVASVLAVLVVHETIALPGWLGLVAVVVGLYQATR